jgi:DeoR family glycerol-3-phosphate regulon repressor
VQNSWDANEHQHQRIYSLQTIGDGTTQFLSANIIVRFCFISLVFSLIEQKRTSLMFVAAQILFALSMSPNPRQAQLLEFVKNQGSVSIEFLADKFDVTLQTVRRDVQRMAEAGLLARFHGGVRLPSSTTENINYRQRQVLSSAAKARIAQSVANRVPNGCSLIMNIGTTMEAIAHALMQHKELRVITNNLNVAAILSDNPECEVIVTGGVVRGIDRGIVGEAAVDFIRQFKVDIGLIGISGIEDDGTLRDYDFREVKVARAIIEHSRQVWLAADLTKFNRPAMVKLAPMSDIDCVFTDAHPSATFVEMMEQAGVECIVAA